MTDHPIIGARPSDVSSDDFQNLIAATAGGHCARLLHGECSAPCLAPNGEYRVDVDHIVGRSLGGTSRLDNLQFLCAAHNRWVKSAQPDSWYKQKLWFDNPPSLERLNPAQIAIWNLIQSLAEYFVNPRSELFDRVLLIAWIVGAGKTMGVLAALSAINFVRLRATPHCRRISRLLWLAPQETLVDQIAHELSDETVSLGLWKRKPLVRKIKSTKDWEIAAQQRADIVVACPQAIWDCRTERQSITDEKLRAYLAPMEAMVADEAHWGTERLLTILRLMPADAFKLATTATPMDRNGLFFCQWANGSVKDRFALFSLFDYEQARNYGMIREIPSYPNKTRYIQVAAGTGEEHFQGDTKLVTNSKARDDIIRSLKIVRQAANQILSDDETRKFHGHMMVICENKTHVRNMCLALRDEDILPHGDGWWPVACYSGPEHERDDKPQINWARLADITHPWMRSKKAAAAGKCVDDRASRIVLVIDIGTFGINQRYAVCLVFAAESHSLIELVQRIGRIIRPVGERDNEPIRIFWSAAFDMETNMAQAIDYLRNMPEHLKRAGFVDIETILAQGTPAEQDLPPVMPRKLTDADVATIDWGLGRRVMECGPDHEVDEEDVHAAVKDWSMWRASVGREADSEETDSAKTHATNMADPAYRRRRFGPQKIECREILLREEPRDDWTLEEIDDAIDSKEIPLPSGYSLDACKEKIRSDAFVLGMFRSAKTTREREFYIRPPVVVTLHQRNSQIANEIWQDLKPHFVVDRTDAIKKLSQCVAPAVGQYFRLQGGRCVKENVADKEAQLVDAASRNYGAYRIKVLAKILLLERYGDIVPTYDALYGDIAHSFQEHDVIDVDDPYVD